MNEDQIPMVWAVVYGEEFQDGFLINESICCMCDTKEYAERVMKEESKDKYGSDFYWQIIGYPLNIAYICQQEEYEDVSA
jgi:hypothetical protein